MVGGCVHLLTTRETSVRVLSIQQPWAWAVVHGPKRVENRTWGTDYRGPLLIHAGRSRERLGDYGTGEPAEKRLTFGAVIGVCELVDCVPYDELPGKLRTSRFAEGPWCWVLADVRPLDPIPMKGKMGLFEPPPDVVELVRAALAAHPADLPAAS